MRNFSHLVKIVGLAAIALPLTSCSTTSKFSDIEEVPAGIIYYDRVDSEGRPAGGGVHIIKRYTLPQAYDKK